MGVLAALQHGVSVAHDEGRRVRHLVLTDGLGTLDFSGFHEAFSRRLVPRLRRLRHIDYYACALEVQPASGRLHGHVLLVEPRIGNGYIPKNVLDGMTSAVGFGWTWITLVRDIPSVRASLSEYFVKGAAAATVPSQAVGQIGSYMAKAHDMTQLRGLAGQRLRPFRVSRNWPISLTAAQKKLQEEMFGLPSDRGPWRPVHESHCGAGLDRARRQQRLERKRATEWEQTRKHLDAIMRSGIAAGPVAEDRRA